MTKINTEKIDNAEAHKNSDVLKIMLRRKTSNFHFLTQNLSSG